MLNSYFYFIQVPVIIFYFNTIPIDQTIWKLYFFTCPEHMTDLCWAHKFTDRYTFILYIIIWIVSVCERKVERQREHISVLGRHQSDPW